MTRLACDTAIVAERNLIRLTRAPDLIAAFTTQPVMFVLLFVYAAWSILTVATFAPPWRPRPPRRGWHDR